MEAVFSALWTIRASAKSTSVLRNPCRTKSGNFYLISKLQKGHFIPLKNSKQFEINGLQNFILFDGYLTHGGFYGEELGILWSVDRLRLKDFGASAFDLPNAAVDGWSEGNFT